MRASENSSGSWWKPVRHHHRFPVRAQSTTNASRGSQSRPEGYWGAFGLVSLRGPVGAIVVALAILVVFFVPLPHLNLFKHPVNPPKISPPTIGSATALRSSPIIFNGRRWRFDGPTWIAVDGNHVWVTNGSSDSVTEFNASTGALIRVLSAPRYEFDYPDAIAVGANRLWVGNAGPPEVNHSVTELNASTGASIQVLSGSSYGFADPDSIYSDGAHLWVANGTADGATVTELNASTGALIRVLSAARYAFDCPCAIDGNGSHLWVANQDGNSLTELNASTGALIRVLSSPVYPWFSSPTAIASYRNRLWVVNYCRQLPHRAQRLDGSVPQAGLGVGLRVRWPVPHSDVSQSALGGEQFGRLRH